jgi:membrane associated rhomboid family serine protease
VELQAGHDDPDGSRTAAALDAYFRLEEIQRFRRALARPLATFAVGMVVMTWFAPATSKAAMEAGLGAACVAGAGVFAVERRTAAQLRKRVAAASTRSAADAAR